MLYVGVNATSANVCVGFDVLGLALGLENVFSFQKEKDFSFTGFEPVYCSTKTNLVYQAYKYYFEYIKMEPIPVKIGFEGKIPVSRGLGSSSSLIVAGVFGADAIAGNRLSQEELFTLCCRLEGHPDNVAPAIYGGLVASYRVDDMYRAIQYPVCKDLRFIVLIPPFRISTHEARGVLPRKLGYEAIVNNLSRIIHIPKAFSEGNIPLLKDLFRDMLHEPYRGKLIQKYDELKEMCKDKDCAVAISGSGSTMLVITKDIHIIEELKKLNYEIKLLEVGQGVRIWRDENE